MTNKPSISVEEELESLRGKIAKLFTEAHTYPELVAIRWPDDFANDVLSLIRSQNLALLDRVSKEAKTVDIYEDDKNIISIKAVPLSSINTIKAEIEK